MSALKKTVSTAIIFLFLTAFFSCASSSKKEEVIIPEPEEVIEEIPEEIPEAPISMEPVFKSTSEELLSVPETRSFLLEDFEDLNYWYAVGNSWDTADFHNLSLSIELTEEWATEGTRSLKCFMDEATKDNSCQATFACNTLTKTDFSKYRWIGFTLFNPNRWDYEINMALSGGKNLKWNETDSIICSSGVTQCLFDLSQVDKKILENIYCLVVQSINENPGQFFYIDEIVLYE